MDVARWIPVSLRWTEHRPEPLLRERTWGCPLPLPADVLARSDYWAEAGFDADDRPVARRVMDRHLGIEATETVERDEDGSIVVRLAEGASTRTEVDATGRAVRTIFIDDQGDESEERYHYDDAGRLTAIDESAELVLAGLVDRMDVGGRLTVEHDEDGLARVLTPASEIVWERPSEPWIERLASAASELAERYRALIGPALEDAGLPAGTPSYGLALMYVDQGSLSSQLMIGLEADRQEAGGGEDGAIATLYIEGELPWIEDGAFTPDLDAELLRRASSEQPDDPYRVVLAAIVRQLVDGDLPGLTKSPDFVGWVAEHDEGLAEKVSSIRLHNSPEAVARWEQGWGADVLPFCVED